MFLSSWGENEHDAEKLKFSVISPMTLLLVVLLTETEEKGFHTHSVHTEKSIGNKVGANYHSLLKEDKHSSLLLIRSNLCRDWLTFFMQQTYQYGNPVVMKCGSCILKGLHRPREKEEGKDSCKTKTIKKSLHVYLCVSN